jgi:hypothetical protein
MPQNKNLIPIGLYRFVKYIAIDKKVWELYPAQALLQSLFPFDWK